MRSFDAVAYAQQLAEELTKPVLVQVWLDDALEYVVSKMQILDTLEVVTQRCRNLECIYIQRNALFLQIPPYGVYE